MPGLLKESLLLFVDNVINVFRREVTSRFDRIEGRLDQHTVQLNRLTGHSLSDAKRDKAMAKKFADIEDELNDLEAASTENTNVTNSFMEQYKTLADMIEASAGNEARIKAIADGLRKKSADMAAAGLANTDIDPSGNQ